MADDQTEDNPRAALPSSSTPDHVASERRVSAGSDDYEPTDEDLEDFAAVIDEEWTMLLGLDLTNAEFLAQCAEYQLSASTIQSLKEARTEIFAAQAAAERAERASRPETDTEKAERLEHELASIKRREKLEAEAAESSRKEFKSFMIAIAVVSALFAFYTFTSNGPGGDCYMESNGHKVCE
ncbi:hypothetical protein GCM10025865_33710 (plasmid) [Paraoerskovia sediminicola]|uniref:Transmembrane protein n=1 Tax=Paraoerskovia sediminicola TaxID=1138587 RepID=A0ABN6XIV7_9CELL|nr:hypothetical protein [Paraoerskovia sediminicola]BDZ44028.1 hypothetical protein GCM10025865_33270 [Paraoerskovia sediminicola]BDZ44072.1 hypothetical protein GCM10025865_33710 [Paraoerskovia sediminicola]